jgi:hypothetical protein
MTQVFHDCIVLFVVMSLLKKAKPNLAKRMPANRDQVPTKTAKEPPATKKLLQNQCVMKIEQT